MKTKPFSSKHARGMTLVEVVLGMVILGILSVVAVSALFFPRYLIEASATERAAMNAGTALIEQLFATPYELIPEGDQPLPDLSSFYSINGRTVTATVYRVENRPPLPAAPEYRYIQVQVTGAKLDTPVILETYRAPLE